MTFDKETWKEFGEGYFTYDGALSIQKGIYGFILIENDQEDNPHRDPLPKTKILFINASEPISSRFYALEFDNFNFTTIAYTESLNDFVAVDTVRSVFSYRNEDCLELIKGNLGHGGYTSTISKTVAIDGDVYAVGGPLKAYKKLGLNTWEEITKNIEIPEDFFKVNSTLILHFQDMDGFSKSDIYAVGYEGIVFHFDEKEWRKIGFPFNTLLSTVTCAGDEQVYISDKDGSVWVGRNSNWKKLVENDMSLSFFDSAWFSNRLWLANDYGMWVLEDDQLVQADKAEHNPVPAEMYAVARRIDVSPDKKRMLVCGPDGAAVYDGEKWELLFNKELLES